MNPSEGDTLLFLKLCKEPKRKPRRRMQASKLNTVECFLALGAA
jgi:hypothetical protein